MSTKYLHILKGALSGLRQFFAIEGPLKMMTNTLYFISKTIFVLKIFNFLSWLFGHVTNRRLFLIFFISILVFFNEHSRITGLQGKGERKSLNPHYHFHPLHRHLDISRAITAGSSPLHIASGRIRTVNLWFPSASR